MKRMIGLVAALGAACALWGSAAAEDLKTVQVGYTAIAPATLILKEKGWLEKDLESRGIAVKWVLSLGSNKTIEFLRGKSLDIGPTSNASALLARANGTPIKLVYWTHRQSGSPILVREDSPIRSIADLKGRKIAATSGTGPHIGLIEALRTNGLTPNDVEIINLQHPQGRLALAAGRVDAWAGLEPDWSIAELQNKARVLYNDTSLAGGGVLDVREEFAERNPEIVTIVLAAFDRARRYSVEHPDEAVRIFAEGSNIEPDVAARAFGRNDLSRPEARPDDAEGLVLWGELFKTLGSIPAEVDIAKIARETVDPGYFRAASKTN